MRRLKNPAVISEKIFELRAERLLLEKQVAALKTQEQALLDNALEAFEAKGVPSFELEGVGKVTITTKPTATIQDFGKVLAFAAEHPDTGVVHKRVSPTQIEKVLHQGGAVPGVVLDHTRVAVARETRKKS